MITQMRSNSLSWSPTLPTVMLLASEDHNLYTFDIRKLETPTQVYKGHVAGVMSCDWSESMFADRGGKPPVLILLR